MPEVFKSNFHTKSKEIVDCVISETVKFETHWKKETDFIHIYTYIFCYRRSWACRHF